jgi:DNA adenine methylase
MQLSPLRYPGGKSKASKILNEFVPTDVNTVVSPFFGGGSFENFLALQGKTVYGYDLCQPLVDFWNAYLTDREKFFDQVRTLSAEILQDKYLVDFTPEDRQEQKDLFFSWKDIALNSDDSFERGVHYFALNRCAFSGLTLIAGPMSAKYIDQKFGTKALGNIEKIQFDVRSVGYQDCVTTIEQNSDKFLYLDPPYVMEKESKESIYGNNGDMHRGFNHEALRDALVAHKERWVLSYLDVPVVRELYSDFNIKSVTWRYTMKPGVNRPEGKELVITNYPS